MITLVNCGYYLYVSKFSFLKTKTSTTKLSAVPVSVIVCAKNEAENLKTNIPLLLSQDYSEFEIILINDNSSDDSLEIMEALALQSDKIRVVDVAGNEHFWGSKKYALTLGIKRAKYEHLLFTDADCAPTSTKWIENMVNHFDNEKTIVLGYGAYHRIKRSWLNKIIRFETVLTAVQYFGYAINRNPYMGVGRNLAYTAKTFYNNRGFMEHIKVASGDDDLFINSAATATNTAICLSPEAFTYSNPKLTWKSWFIQKRRHTSVAQHYKTKHKLQLGFFYLSQILFLITAFILLALGYNWQLTAMVIVVRYAIAWSVIGSASGKLNERDLLIWFPLIEIFLLLFQLSIFITNLLAKPKRWK